MRCKGKGKRAKKLFLCCSRPATDSDEELPESKRCQNHCKEPVVAEVEAPPISVEDIPPNPNNEEPCIEDHPDGDNIHSRIQTVLVEMHKGDPNEFEQNEGEDVIDLPEIIVTIDNSEQTDYIDETDQEIQNVTNDMKDLGAELVESAEKSPVVKVLEAGEVMQSKADTRQEECPGMSTSGDDMLEAVLEPIVTKRRNSVPHLFSAVTESHKCDISVEQALEELSEHMAKDDNTNTPDITDDLRQYVCEVIEKAVIEVTIEQISIQERLNTDKVVDDVKPTVAEQIKEVCDIVDDASNLTSEAEDEIVDDMIEFVIEEAISDMTVHTPVLNGSPLTKHISSPLMYQTSVSGSNMIWGRPDINISTIPTRLHSHNMPVPSCATPSDLDKADTSVTNSSAPSTASMDWDGYIPSEDVKTDDEQQSNSPP